MNKLPKYLAVLGKPREELDTEEGATIADILASAGIERHEGEVLIVAEVEVTDEDVLPEGSTLFYVPPVDLGL